MSCIRAVNSSAVSARRGPERRARHRPGAFAGWALHPLESAALPRSTPTADISVVWLGDRLAGPEAYARWVTEVINPFTREEDHARLVEGMRLAGLPV